MNFLKCELSYFIGTKIRLVNFALPVFFFFFYQKRYFTPPILRLYRNHMIHVNTSNFKQTDKKWLSSSCYN